LSIVKKNWSKIEKKYFKALVEVTNKPIYTDKFNCSLTTFGMCPYDVKKSWFMVSTRYDFSYQLTVIAHEIMHLQFIRQYYQDCRKKGLSRSQFEDLKEALTVLLNTKPFSAFLIAEDKGYVRHQQLRRYILKVWSKDQDFENLLNQSIKFILKNNQSNI